MESKIVTRNEKKIIGIATQTSNQLETHQSTAKIPGAWESFHNNGTASRIPDRVEPGIILGVYTHYEDNHHGKYTLITGAEVSSLENIPEDMVGITAPPAKYLKFSHKGTLPGVAIDMWRSIWAIFSEDSDYRRIYTTDFEVYDSENPELLEIFIAVE